MSGIRIVNAQLPNRKPAASPAAANMILWVGILALIWGLLAKFNLAGIGVGVALCVLGLLQMKKIGKKVCPSCRAAIEWEASTCPSCHTSVD